MEKGAEAFSFADCPGYLESVAREGRIRDIACLGLNETICGLEVKPLCAEHVALLSLIRSPFLYEYPVKALLEKPDIFQDVQRFLWIVSPHYKAGVEASPYLWRRWFESKKRFAARLKAAETPRDRFNRDFTAIGSIKSDKVIEAILEYVEESYIDTEESKHDEIKKIGWAFQISIASELHEHYGYRIDFWNPDCPADKNPLLVPLKIIAQLRKYRAAMNGQPITNRSDKTVEAALNRN